MFPDWLTQFELWWLWQYWLWSFQTWDTNLERFFPKTQHTLKVKFWQLWQLLIQNSKFNHFVWVCWFLNKNLSNLTTRIAIMMMSSQALNEGRKTQTWLCYCFCGSRKTLTKKKKNFCLLTLYTTAAFWRNFCRYRNGQLLDLSDRTRYEGATVDQPSLGWDFVF